MVEQKLFWLAMLIFCVYLLYQEIWGERKYLTRLSGNIVREDAE
ncbi:MAG: hypothetical protein DDT22_00859 [candidate division WS2 bacterium]|nr:hypothetical protein [Candidatus Lithacetigena glycinireducens]